MSVEITGESVKSAIARKLAADFGSQTPAPKLYKEQILQNLVKPYFFIWIMDVSQEKLMNRNYTLAYQMNIRYHPKDEDTATYETLSSVAIKLFETLSTIELPVLTLIDDVEVEQLKPVVGSQMNYSINDGVLQFYVTYNLRVMKDRIPRVIMNNLEVNEI